MATLNALNWLMVMLILGPVQTPATSPSYILKFPETSTTSYAKPEVTFPSPLNAFTICYRIRPCNFTRSNAIFSYATKDNHDEITLGFDAKGTPQVGVKIWLKLAFMSDIRTFQCGVWDQVCARWSIDKNFHLKSRRGLDLVGPVKNTPVQTGGVLILGQDQDTPGGGFDPTEVYHGELTDLHIWNYTLSDEAG